MSVLKRLQPVRFLPTSVAWSVSQLFAAGEQGAWYDPSDLSTLFQDEAGTTPVTAVEQPVGRILDKSGRGNHATQAATTKRPLYSRRVNLLTKTEQFDHAAWSKSGATITANTGIAPDGTSTADSVTFSSSADYVVQQFVGYTTTVGAQFVISLHVKSTSRLLFFGGATPAGTDIYTSTPLAGGWYLQKVVRTFTVATTGNIQYVFSGTNATGTFEVWGASITLATDAHLPYQRVNTATDYDADPAKFPAYLRFDGVDDALQTGNIDFTSTDKMTVWAGVTALDMVRASGAPGQLLYSNGDNFNGFGLRAPSSGGVISFTSSGNVGIVEPSSAFHGTAPVNLIMCGYGDQVAPLSVLRSNGVQLSALNTAQGTTGGYGNRSMWLASQSGTSRFFNGRLYSLIVRGAQTGGATVEAVERYIKSKVRMP